VEINSFEEDTTLHVRTASAGITLNFDYTAIATNSFPDFNTDNIVTLDSVISVFVFMFTCSLEVCQVGFTQYKSIATNLVGFF